MKTPGTTPTEREIEKSEHVILTFDPKWAAGLAAYLADEDLHPWDFDLWHMQFHPEGEHGAVIVAGSRWSCAIIRDPKTVMGGRHKGRALSLALNNDFVKACSVRTITFRDVNGDPYEVDDAPWATPDLVSVTALGVGSEHPMTTWRIHAKGDPPGVDKETADDMGWALASGSGRAEWVHQPFPWQKAVRPSAAEPTGTIQIQTEMLAGLKHFGRKVRLAFEGRLGRVTATFDDAPEVTVLLMPMREDSDAPDADTAEEETPQPSAPRVLRVIDGGPQEEGGVGAVPEGEPAAAASVGAPTEGTAG